MIRSASIDTTATAPSKSGLLQWAWLVSIPLAAVLLYWSLRGVDWAHIWAALAAARPGWLMCSAAVTAVNFLLRAIRWRILLNAEERLGVGTVFRSNMVGYLANNFLPARAGEVLRSVMISRGSRLSNAYVLTTALAERLIDASALLLAGSLAALSVEPKPRWLTDVSRGTALIAAAGVLAVMVAPHAEGLIGKLLQWIPLPLRLRTFLQATTAQVLLGLRGFHHPGRLAGFSALTALIWSIDGVAMMTGARGMNLTVTFPMAMLLLTAIGLGSALPSTPGAIGIYQAAAVIVLTPFGIPRVSVLAFSFMIQAVGYVVVVLLGLPCLYASRRTAAISAAA